MHGLSCSAAYEVFSDQELNLCLLHWQAYLSFEIKIYLFWICFPLENCTSPATCSSAWQQRGENRGPAGTPSKRVVRKADGGCGREATLPRAGSLGARREGKAAETPAVGQQVHGTPGSWEGVGGHAVALVGPLLPGSLKGSRNQNCRRRKRPDSVFFL